MCNSAIWSTDIKWTDLGSGVHNIHESAARIRLHDGLQHLLILQAASTEARKRLTAATYRGLKKRHLMSRCKHMLVFCGVGFSFYLFF